MREGSLDAPTRHALDWTDPDFYDWDKINAEAPFCGLTPQMVLEVGGVGCQISRRIPVHVSLAVRENLFSSDLATINEHVDADCRKRGILANRAMNL